MNTRQVRSLSPWAAARADEFQYRLAHAAAWDAGNKHAREAGRDKWNEDDYNAMCAEFARLMPDRRYRYGR